MKAKSSATLLFIMTGVVTLLGGGGAFMLYNSLSGKNDELAKLKSEAKDPKELEKELATRTKEMTANAATLSHLEKGIPELAYVPTMLKELEATGKKCGIQVYGVRPTIPVATTKKAGESAKKREKPYEELTIEVKGKGKYRSVLQFVSAMNDFPKIVAVRTVGLMPKNESGVKVAGGYSNLEITLELRAFLFKPNKKESEVPSTDGGASEKSSASSKPTAQMGAGGKVNEG